MAWLRLDLRRRWRSLAVLALLIALAGGTVLTSLAAARRGASARDRLAARTVPATAAILANTVGFDWDKIRSLPEVEVFSAFGPSVPIPGFPPAVEAGFMLDDDIGRTIEMPVIYDGRMFDRSRVDEAFASPKFMSHFHKGVGDTVVFNLPTPAEFQAHGGSGPDGAYTGPRLRVRIVGVGISPWFSDDSAGQGGIILTPAVTRRYPLNVMGSLNPKEQYVNALVRLDGGRAAITRLRADVARVSGRSDIDVWDLADQLGAPFQRQVTFESRCLVAFAAAALVAAMFLVGQAIARYAAASTTELQTLRALGLSPPQAIATATAGPAVVGVIGGCVGVLAAVGASRWFPYGTASLAEPAPGTSVDWVVFGPGLVVIVVLVTGGAATAAWLALGAARRSATARRSAIARTVAAAGFAAPVVIGTRFALEAGRGRTAVPVRPALIGAVTGVLGVLAAFTFSHGVTDAIHHPERFGQTYQLNAFLGDNGQDVAPPEKLFTALRADRDVIGVDDARIAVATGADGDSSVTLYTYSAGSKPIDVVVTSGRMPRKAGEVLLAPRSIKALHTRIGETVSLTGSRTRSLFTVTGSGLVPAGFHNAYDDGGWVTAAGYDVIFKDYKFRAGLVALRPDARGTGAGTTLSAQLAKTDPALANVSFAPPDLLSEVAQLRQVRVLPIGLGLFLALLAVGAVGHALATAVRRRSHDLAVLRALGMTQAQCRWVVVTQATVLAAIGLLFGVPLGLGAGRTVWRVVADYTPLQYVAPMAVWAMLLAVPVALLIANVLAAWPGHRAARLRIAQVLRTE
ncbi:MAG: FtsX-like permease family protein [Actinomycetota bacterium]|nr:FtsX-like permease family protein [Actinomycetota bacterium]